MAVPGRNLLELQGAIGPGGQRRASCAGSGVIVGRAEPRLGSLGLSALVGTSTRASICLIDPRSVIVSGSSAAHRDAALVTTRPALS